jgi:glycosyltransferase involved in cell wall biosynthesis
MTRANKMPRKDIALPRINILIDVSSITKNKAGVGVYAKHLVHELSRLRGDFHLFLLAQNDDADFDYPGVTNVTTLRIPARIFRRRLARVLLEQIAIPFLILRHRIHVIHSLHYTFPLLRFRAKQVVTFHDMTFFLMPELHLRRKAIFFRCFIRLAVRLADSLIFVSHHSRNDCLRMLGPSRGTVSVIHHGSSKVFRADHDAQSIAWVKQKYGLTGDFLLYLGTIEPRKNLRRLVTVFASLAARHEGLILVIAGMNGWMSEGLFEEVLRLNLGSRIQFLGFVAEDDKPVLLAAAQVFVYPSLYEGFGLPVLEALASGTATVTSNTSAMPEVAGSAALLVDPTNERQLFDAIEGLLRNRGLRQRLRSRAIAHAAQFTWHRTAVSTAAVYRDALRRATAPSTPKRLTQRAHVSVQQPIE